MFTCRIMAAIGCLPPDRIVGAAADVYRFGILEATWGAASASSRWGAIAAITLRDNIPTWLSCKTALAVDCTPVNIRADQCS